MLLKPRSQVSQNRGYATMGNFCFVKLSARIYLFFNWTKVSRFIKLVSSVCGPPNILPEQPVLLEWQKIFLTRRKSITPGKLAVFNVDIRILPWSWHFSRRRAAGQFGRHVTIQIGRIGMTFQIRQLTRLLSAYAKRDALTTAACDLSCECVGMRNDRGARNRCIILCSPMPAVNVGHKRFCLLWPLCF